MVPGSYDFPGERRVSCVLSLHIPIEDDRSSLVPFAGDSRRWLTRAWGASGVYSRAGQASRPLRGFHGGMMRGVRKLSIRGLWCRGVRVRGQRGVQP